MQQLNSTGYVTNRKVTLNLSLILNVNCVGNTFCEL